MSDALRLPSATRRSILRRVQRALAVLLVACLGSFQLEALIADVCDGDATTRARALAVHEAPSEATTAPSSPDASDPGAPPAPAGHPVHTCHCVHAHGGGVLPRLDVVVVRVVDVATALPTGHPLAASDVARVPLPRPPLA